MAIVDIVIPLYNKANYIDRAVESVLGQTVEDWQLIVVDDGSDDQGPGIVQRRNDPRITVIQQENQGPGAARNRGWRSGSSPFIAFLDADDEWLPDFLERTVSALEEHPDCAMCCTSWYAEPGGQDVYTRYRIPGVAAGPWRCPSDVEPRWVKAAVDFCHNSTIVVRRTMMERFGGYYQRDHCTYGEDSFLWLQLLMNEKIYRLPQPLAYMHYDASSLGALRRTAYPLPPILEHKRQVLRGCPTSHRHLLATYLSWYAMFVASRMSAQENHHSALRILRNYCNPAHLPASAFPAYLRTIALIVVRLLRLKK